ncbi:MAG: methyltransferase domain-containing protein [Candidatus Kuenenia sp.]|nr:methyltransferase domain-containing protein [Candidatus Kuenenia hertensis]
MANRTLFLTNELYKYMISSSVREPDILRQLRRETSHDQMSAMQISPEQGQFMAFLLKLQKATKAIEIGVYTGYSSLCIALALPPDGKLVACDINKEWTSVAQRYWEKAGVSKKIDLHLAPGIETLNHLISNGNANTYDFIFIDADKKNYDIYYERAINLLRPGGIIVIDNVFWLGKVTDHKIIDDETNAIQRLNKKLHNDERIDLSMIPVGDGLTLAMKR